MKMTDQKAISWLKMRIGKLMGCKLIERDKVYKLAIDAIESRQAMKERAKKRSTPKN